MYCISMHVCVLDLEVDRVVYCISMHVCMLDLEVVGWSSVLCQRACVYVRSRGGWLE